MEQKDIKKILSDLYAIDPNLESKEADLVLAVKIMQGRKNNEYDKEFSAELRERLLSEIGYKNKSRNRYLCRL
jgi:hypothetical protein